MQSDQYNTFEDDNQVSYDDFLDHLKDQKAGGELPEDLDLSHIMVRMKDLMIDCHLAV